MEPKPKDSKGRFISARASTIIKLARLARNSHRSPEIVEFPYDRSVNRFGKTYSIREDGEFWLTSNGSRRAWSSWEAANDALLYELRGF
tara:strand:- start:21 stop:287 length:267 start_codon:yes stop_codon:yes gene_type:complete